MGHQICTTFASCLYDYQTLIAGALSLLAAIIAAAALWWTSGAPIRSARSLREEDDDRRRRYAGNVITQDLLTLRARCRAIEGTITVLAAGNHAVKDEGRAQLLLPVTALASDWEFMSRLPPRVLSELMKLWRHVADHNSSMAAVGSFADENWRRFAIDRLQALAKAANALSGQTMLLAEGRPQLPAAPIQLD